MPPDIGDGGGGEPLRASGEGGAPHASKAVRGIIIERFGDEIPTKTLQNWKSDIEGQMEKYNLSKEYIQEVIDRALRDVKRERENSGTPSGKDTGAKTPGDNESGNRERARNHLKLEGRSSPTHGEVQHGERLRQGGHRQRPLRSLKTSGNPWGER